MLRAQRPFAKRFDPHCGQACPERSRMGHQQLHPSRDERQAPSEVEWAAISKLANLFKYINISKTAKLRVSKA
jgi:hypothetical protein